MAKLKSFIFKQHSNTVKVIFKNTCLHSWGTEDCVDLTFPKSKISSKIKKTREWISELRHRLFNNTQMEGIKEKEIKRNEESLWELKSNCSGYWEGLENAKGVER